MARTKAVAVFLTVVAALILGAFFYPRQSVAEEPRNFSDKDHLAQYIRTNMQLAELWNGWQVTDELAGSAGAARPAPRMAAESAVQKQAAASDSYSTTNIQVEGVDEADIIKNDGKYLYTVSGGQVHILEAYPAEKARVLSTIRDEGRPSGIYLSGSRLVVISRAISAPGTLVSVYDITDRARPARVKSLAWEGGYVSSRMIGGRVYLVLNMPVTFEGDDIRLPRLTENGLERMIAPGEIYYFDYPDRSYSYTMIASVSAAGEEGHSTVRTFLTGASQVVYASPENLYLTGEKAPDMGSLAGSFIEGLLSLATGEAAVKIREIVSSPAGPDQKIARAEQVLEGYMAGLEYSDAAALEEKIGQLRGKFYRDIVRERNKTVIYKFYLREGNIEYKCRGEINGRLLNQFSMDEDKGYFRAATTSQGNLLSNRTVTRNNIYVMDQDLKVVGRLEGLAPTERIYSARFMGSRVYLVTFKQIDPLFVIDLKDPQNPKVLGELKIPGYSDYLHPYDENHLIGVGKEVAPVPAPAPLREDGPAVRMEIMPFIPVRPQGVKIALFDVSDPARPVEVDKYIVDQPYSDSEVSRNHRAFLFSRARNLMALPVSFQEVRPLGLEKGMPGVHWQGMYVFSISPENGIKLKGGIAHPSPAGERTYQYYDPVRRASYINDVLYTVSDGAVKLSRIEDLKEIAVIRLPRDERVNWPMVVKKRDLGLGTGD